MKRIKFLMVCVAVMFLTGCAGMLTGCEEYDPVAMQGYAAKAEQIGEQVSVLQASLAPALEAIEKGGLIDPGIAEKVAKVNEEINRIKPQLSQVTQSLQEYQFDSGGYQGLIDTAQVINGATAAINPYSVPIGLGLTVLSTVFGYIALWQKGRGDKATEALGETVTGIEAFKKEDDVGNKALLNSLGTAQSNRTKLMVAELKI